MMGMISVDKSNVPKLRTGNLILSIFNLLGNNSFKNIAIIPATNKNIIFTSGFFFGCFGVS